MPTDLPHVALAPVTVPRDLPMLRDWLRRPHVTPWWGDPDDVLDFVSRHDTDAHAFITVDDKPVGYVCWQRPAPDELTAVGLDSLPADLIDLDIAIGETEYLGRGVGPRALGLVLERLSAEGVAFAGIACAAANLRARKAYEKAGFRVFGKFQEAGDDMYYLLRNLQTPT